MVLLLLPFVQFLNKHKNIFLTFSLSQTSSIEVSMVLHPFELYAKPCVICIYCKMTIPFITTCKHHLACRWEVSQWWIGLRLSLYNPVIKGFHAAHIALSVPLLNVPCADTSRICNSDPEVIEGNCQSLCVCQRKHCLTDNSCYLWYSFTGYSTRLMEKNGPNLIGLPQPSTRDPPECAVGAHGEQVQMSAVSPGPEEACPGSVRPPLLCPLLQAAHQVGRRSSDRKPLTPWSFPLTGHAPARPVFLSLLASGDFLHPRSNNLFRLIPHMIGLVFLKSVNCKDLTMLILFKGLHFFSLSFSCHWLMKREFTTNTLVYHLISNDCLTVSLGIIFQHSHNGKIPLFSRDSCEWFQNLCPVTSLTREILLHMYYFLTFIQNRGHLNFMWPVGNPRLLLHENTSCYKDIPMHLFMCLAKAETCFHTFPTPHERFQVALFI